MKANSRLLEKLDAVFSADELPFHKKRAEDHFTAEQTRETVSFKGFWTENFSRKAIKEKIEICRENYSGSSEAARKNRRLASFKGILVFIAFLLGLLSSMISQYYFINNSEKYDGRTALSHILDIGMNVKAMNDTVGDIRTAAEADIREKNKGKHIPDHIVEVPFYSQKDYPTGCELVSASMLLSYYGIDIAADEFIKEGYIETKKVYLDGYGDPYGPDPDMYFIGDPLEDDGYGCYSGAMISAFKKILPQNEYEVVDLKGWSVDEICRKYIDNDIPVLFWGSLNMDAAYFDEVNQWFIEEGERKGEKFKWLSNEHCMVLVGHDESFYYFNDPSADKPGTVFGRPLVEVRYAEMGRQAVAIVKK